MNNKYADLPDIVREVIYSALWLTVVTGYSTGHL